MKRRSLLIGGALALTAALAGCSSDSGTAKTEGTAADGAAPAAASGKKYVFYHVLWDMTDANVQFHVNAGKKYMEDHPNVEIKYIGPEKYDPAEHAKFLETAIAAKPDGIAMHISSADALLPALQKAKDAGIPFVSVTSHPPSEEDNAKLAGLYVTWVGADESKIGGVMAERVLKEGTPKRVAYLMAHLGHAGQEQRATGFFEAMPEGVETDKVEIGEEPQAAMDAIRSYINAKSDVGVLFGSAPANKWIVDVLKELGRTDIKVLTSDDAPSSLECVLQGFCLATFTQQFPIQAPFAYEALLQQNVNGMGPTGPIITGPAVIDKSNAEQYKKGVLEVFGADGYKKLAPF